MGHLQLWLLALAGLAAIVAQEDLYRKVFVFRKDPSDAFVVLRARLEQPLHNFTVCLRSYSDLSRPHSLFSYATKAQDNEILLFKPKPEEYRFYVGGKFVTFRVPESRRDWEHVCASWESATGIAEFWFNGKPWPRKGLQRGYTVGATASILWDAGLSPEKMRAAFLSLRLPPALLAWKSLSWAPTPARPPAAGAGLWPPTPCSSHLCLLSPRPEELGAGVPPRVPNLPRAGDAGAGAAPQQLHRVPEILQRPHPALQPLLLRHQNTEQRHPPLQAQTWPVRAGGGQQTLVLHSAHRAGGE